MTEPPSVPRQQYIAWVEDQIEEYKAGLSREDLLSLAEQAVERIHSEPDGQIALTELLLCDAVDSLLVERLDIPDFRAWKRMCRTDTSMRSLKRTDDTTRAAS